jgi:competence protein ComGC
VHRRICSCRWAFTLIELLVVIGIVVVAVLLLLPVLSCGQKGYGRTYCANNLRQLAFGTFNYTEMHPQVGPPAVDAWFPAGTIHNPDLQPERRLSWLVDLLPYIEEQRLYDFIERQAAWDAAANAYATRRQIRLLQCPGWRQQYPTESENYTTYVGPAGLGEDAAALPLEDPRAGIFGYDRRIGLKGIRDGLANTLLILETARDNGPWAQGGPATVRGLDPADQPYLGPGRPFGGIHFADGGYFQRARSLGCNVAMADASVRLMSDDVAPEVFRALLTANGGERIDSDW